MSTSKTALLGEQLVLQALPKAEWTRDQYPYPSHDIKWNGIKIEVKTTRQVFDGVRGARYCLFSNINNTDGNVGVFVAYLEDGVWYWVKSLSEVGSSFYAKFSESITDSSLISLRVKEESKKSGEHPKRTKKMMIQVDPETQEELKLRSYYLGLSVSAYVRMLIKEYLAWQREKEQEARA